MRLARFSTIIAAVCLTAPVFAAKSDSVALPSAKPESVDLSSQRLTQFVKGMQGFVDEGRLAGAVTMVSRHGKVVEFDAVGKRDIASNATMQKDSIFRIYSMSKPITGVAMMILFEEGKWQLNDPISKYIPEFKDLKVWARSANGNIVMKAPDHPPMMRELMSHNAGFTYGIFSETPVDKLQRDADVLNINNSLDEFIKRMSKVPLNAEPGSEWHYSVSVDIQGYLVQKLSGMPFDKFLEERVFKPLKMVDTGFYVPKDKLDRFAQVYTYDKQGKLAAVGTNEALNHDFSADPNFKSGGGGLVSTTSDYMRLCQMLLNGGELDGVRILSPRTVELMRTNVLSPSAAAQGILTNGSGFGLDFAVITDPMAAGGYYGKGSYYWGGAAGTWFWIDPVNELIVVGMIQQFAAGNTGAAPVATIPDVRGLSHTWVYQSFTK
jgi:CubicO group peptidase (beta-lactamase class C family)